MQSQMQLVIPPAMVSTLSTTPLDISSPAGSSSLPSSQFARSARPLHSSCCSSLWTWHSCSCSSDTCTLIPRVTTTPDWSRPVDTSVYLQLFWRGTMPWLVLRMTAIPSSSFPSHTSHGLTRDASARPRPSARPSSRLPRLANSRAYLTFEREMEGMGFESKRYYTRLAGCALHGDRLREWEGH